MRPRLSLSVVFLACACGVPAAGDTVEWNPVPAEDVNRGTEPGAGGGSSVDPQGGGGDAGAAGDPSGGAGNTGTAGMVAAGGSPGGDGCLTVSFTTVSPKGKYSPRNVGAIWVTDSKGAYVKTLTVWAGKRAKYLSQWIGASGGDKVDAVTSATLSSHGLRQGVWNCKDRNGNAMPSGAYVVHAEITDRDGPGPNMQLPITIDAAPFDTAVPDEASVPNFIGRHLVHP